MCIKELKLWILIGTTFNTLYRKVKVHLKLLISQSKFSGTRKFTLRYQLFEIKGNEYVNKNRSVQIKYFDIKINLRHQCLRYRELIVFF